MCEVATSCSFSSCAMGAGIFRQIAPLSVSERPRDNSPRTQVSRRALIGSRCRDNSRVGGPNQIFTVHYWTQSIPNPMPNTGHIPSGSRHCVWTLRGNGRFNRFLRANNNSSRTADRRTITKATTSNSYRRSLADVRHGSQATEVQPKSWESGAPCPSEPSP